MGIETSLYWIQEMLQAVVILVGPAMIAALIVGLAVAIFSSGYFYPRDDTELYSKDGCGGISSVLWFRFYASVYDRLYSENFRDYSTDYWLTSTL